jgi:WD40 repeat protein
MAAALLPRDTSSFFVIGDDGLVSVWPVVPGREAIHLGTKVHEKVVGRNSRIAFSRSDHELLWCLDGEANLKVVDATSGTVKGRQEKAHANSAKGTVGDLAVLPSGGAVTVGGDTRMRFWSWSGDSIVSEGESIEHKKPLISVAASDNGRWVAAVDSQSGVAIWRVADRVQQFYQESPSLHEQPHTGDCAFNRSATRFAAFGAGQTALVFDCRDDDGRLVVRRMPDQLNVAGTRGGTALHWSPIDQNRIAHADDDRRFQFINWTSDERREKPGPVVDSPVIAIDSTPDLRRVLYVTQAGLLGSYDARHEILMAEFSSSLTDVCTMSIDPSGNRVALANSAGSLEIWHSAAQTVDLPVSLVDETELWKGRDWLQRDSAIVKLPWRPIKVDETGNAHVLVTEAQPSAFRSDAALYLVYEDGEKMTRERITVGQAEFDDRMTVEACALELRAGQPVVAFRCRTAERSPYDGQLVLAKRVAQGKWEREWIEREGNMGFSPQIAFNAAGEVRELFHFSFDGYYLTHSHRTADVWQSKFVGQQGDGRLLDARFDSGVLHLFSDSNRYNGDPVQGVYMRWEAGKEMVREQLPLDRSFQRQISTLPNGEPVVMERIEAYPECRLWHRGESGWRVRQSIPRFICLNSTAWEIGPDGATYVVAWDPTGKRLVLWRGIGDDWKGSVISTKLPSSPNWLWIGFDHEQLPLLVAGEQRIPFAWLRAFRRH